MVLEREDDGRGTRGPSPRQRLAILATGAAWLIGIRAGLVLLAAVIGTQPLAEAVLGALVVDVLAGRAGLSWSEDEPTKRELLRRTLVGAGLGGALAGAALAVSLAAGWATITATGVGAAALVGTVGVAAGAVRDELLYRGLPILFAARAGVPRWAVVAFAALASPSGFLFTAATTPGAVALSIGAGALFAVLYLYGRGAWIAVGAHASFAIVTDVLARGGLADLQWASGELAEGAAATGAPAYVGAAIAIAMAAWRAREGARASKATPAARSPRGRSRRRGRGT